ncbi:MarR family winged helix-turn-helix transcriptional regulator [Novosphingobium colocasiae]|uniref:Transcriptional regulator n=1 Tax=Novosphingobium colocasiae TaxID=1256513 RepID=A0A918UE89_9SPHN|nr:MarR family winged helix-turn-helix transcriptional regulator [Novosphingobium colocasiae]GGY96411.1 transcriptional regulator [Novosphingobium colocasiae]
MIAAEQTATRERSSIVDDEIFINTPRRQVCIQITVLARTLRGYFDRRIAGLNVTRSQWNMISAVSKEPGSTQRTIADRLEMSEASAGRLIDRLCADGLLERHERADDRRARAVYLAEPALPLVRSAGAMIANYEATVFEGFEDAEIEQLLGYIQRINVNTSRKG